eukprot:TRINITY_DN2578_c0_g1_i1.p1 TRINITY_DN2578_c0_g1~~TRINITY_DN2578_c0_g1_i1.p1  ORF type:complete len:471 (+),score=145.55 TRINITY_DN2578_c0_g1_i1:117-1415(+)
MACSRWRAIARQLFGGSDEVLRWAGRMASYHPVERQLLRTPAFADPAPAPAPAVESPRAAGPAVSPPRRRGGDAASESGSELSVEARKLASVVTIDAVKDHPMADRLSIITVKGWQVVSNKERDQFRPGDRAVYCEVDSIVPERILVGRAEHEILAKSKFRVKTARIRGCISQGVLFTLDILRHAGMGPEEWGALPEGANLTAALGLTKYDPAPSPIPACGQPRGSSFPKFVPKTEEERVQNIPKFISQWHGKRFYLAEKVDGSSFTCFLLDGDFGVCSRNQRVAGAGFHWTAAAEAGLERRLREAGLDGVALQGELLGPPIQKNRYHFPKLALRFFSVYMIKEKRYLPVAEAEKLVQSLGLEWVPIIDREFVLTPGHTVDTLLEMAEGKSKLRAATEREGLVFRSVDEEYQPGFGRISFKVISNKWLLKFE